MSKSSQSSGGLIGNAIFLFFFIPLLIVAAILRFLFHAIGGWFGLLAALLTAGVVYCLWYDDTKYDPVPPADGIDPEPAPGAIPEECLVVGEGKDCGPDTNQVREEMLGCWENIKEILGIAAGTLVCGLLYWTLYLILGPVGMVFLGRVLLWAAVVASLVGGAMYVTKAYRRGHW